VYVCNPNNPTGTVHAAGDIDAFVKNVHKRSSSATILIDEAYHEYVDSASYRSAAPLAVADPRVVVTRTFSKVHGMAGLRIGYVIGQAQTIRALRPWLASLSIANLGAAAARASLTDTVHVEQQRALNREARQITRDALERVGHRAFASDANFLMVHIARDARGFAASCMAQGIQVARPFPPLTQHVRISVGTRDEMNRSIPVFLDVLAQPPSVTSARWVDVADDGRRAC
jgi:histidinol-phosphate aminotransferase